MGRRFGFGATNPDGTLLDYSFWPGPTHRDWADTFTEFAEAFARTGSSLSDWGYTPRRNGKTAVSSHSSGLAMDISAPVSKLMINENHVEMLMNYGAKMSDIVHVFEVFARRAEEAVSIPTTPPKPKNHGPRSKRQYDHRGRRRY